jgi:hypothetical protein
MGALTASARQPGISASTGVSPRPARIRRAECERAYPRKAMQTETVRLH